MLRIQGRRTVPRGPEVTWARLLEPESLCRSIPGCSGMELWAPHTYRFLLRVGHGVIRGKFHGEVRFMDILEVRSLRLEFLAKGFAGSIAGHSSVLLRPSGDSTVTEVVFDGEARVRGLLRTISRHVFEEAIESFADHVFEELARE